MYAGFCNVDADYVAVMDADMQDPPSLLPEMIQILESGKYDSVATRRKTEKVSRQFVLGVLENFINLLIKFQMLIL